MFGGNKLRTYRTFKNEFITEPYLSIIVHKKYRSAYAKFRCGVAPLKIETGRYGVNRVPVEERLCETCNSVEDEFHVLMKCPLYRDARDICFNSISAVSEVFADLPQESQFIELISNPLHYKIISKFMYTILNQRRYLLHWSTNFNFFFLARTLTTDSYRVWAADSESALRFTPSHQVFELFDILYLSMFIC